MPKSSSPIDRDSTDLTTWFASARRADQAELVQQIAFITASPVVNAVLTSLSGLMAVLNADRQILAVNDSFLGLLGLPNPAEALGLRPGEVLHCVHSGDNAAGCGTGEFCSTCGLAIAIVATLSTNAPCERKCILTREISGVTDELCFLVKTSILNLKESRFILVFLQDISKQERSFELARIFCHDIKNKVMGLGCTIDQLSYKKMKDSPQLHGKIRRLSDNLIREVKIQSAIVNNSYNEFPLSTASCTVFQIVRELREMFAHEPAAQGKALTIGAPLPRTRFSTDLQLLVRVLTNMLLNAFEATEEGGEVKLSVERQGASISFHVRNRSVIPADTAKRVFQRYFSTKRESGRGLGTFSMKLIGETLLGGKVEFTTSKNEGTVFTFTLPIR